MQRRLLLVVVAVLFLVVILGGAAFFLLNPDGQSIIGGAPTDTPVPVTATPEAVVQIVAASQGLARGVKIPEDAVILIPWPKDRLLPSVITDTKDVIGKRARYTINPYEPLLSTMIVSSLQDLSPDGSDAAAQIPPGLVGLTLPYDRRNGVNLAIRDGDHVSLIVSWQLVDYDENFQTILPNLSTDFQRPPADTSESGGSAVALIPPAPLGAYIGRIETEPVSGQDLMVVPDGPQQPRMVTQGIIQDALVLHMGVFYEDAPRIFNPTATPDTSGTPTVPPPPTPTPTPPEEITLAVTPQDALVIEYIKRLSERYPGVVQITLVLRSAGDTSVTTTESVTMQYMFEKFSITLPSKLPFGLAPAPTPVPTAAP